MLGRTVSHYRIVSELGAGGMGVVYGAEDVRLGRPVALKFVHDELAQDRHAIERFQFEAKAASALNHPNICTIYDIGEDGPRPFIVMELMKGQTLRERLATGSMKPHRVVDAGIQVADALDAAHREGIVHRDIKPANIFLTDRGQAKVLDFGLAKLSPRRGDVHSTGPTTAVTDDVTATSVTMGTVAYMSPEQATGDELDGRTDLFSLGVVLYECATGHRPFAGNNSVAVLAAILNRAPVAPVVLNPELPLRLQEIIYNCLEKDRELRYQTAADLRADLKRARRDLESGHSGVVIHRVGHPPSSGLAAAPGSAESAEREAAPVPGGSFPAGRRGAMPTTRRGRMWRWAAASSVVAVVLTMGSTYWRWQRSAAPTSTVAVPAPPPKVADAGTSMAPPRAHAPVEPAPGAGPPPAASDPAAGPRNEAASAPRSTKEPASAPRATSGRVAARDTPAPPTPAPRRADTVPPGALPETTAPPPVSTPTFVTPAAPVQAPTQAAVPPTAPPPTQATAPPPTPTQNAPAPGAGQPHDARTQAPPPAPAEDDEAAIRRVVASYGRAIETKNLALFRSLKPNLSGDEEQRLQTGFRAVGTQRVSLTVAGIDRRGTDARVRVKRRDVFEAGGRTRTTETEQLLTLARTAGGWILVDIGR